MKRLSRVLLVAFLMLTPFAASAQLKLLPECATTSNTDQKQGVIAGSCTITDVLAVFGNLAEFLLGIVGAVALLYFVYGGFVFILSRGNKGEVDRAFGILRSAAIGIFIIFLSGVFVRFTIQALTGGTSGIPTIGETCRSGANAQSDPKGDGIWVLMPAGVDINGKTIPEGLECIKKEVAATKPGADCQNLNSALKDRQRPERYTCVDVNTATTSCVRGLCSQLSSQFACCKKPTP